jgi:DNA-binding response OmpR family regulator/KaiC/GvpD/RAD55 family RecA-like ATPase
MMTAKALNLIPSGIEPIDKLSGGLENGHLYLAHGEAAGKSLFGIKFLIEGLKRGESGALVIRYSAEDAVRRFARLGYDCLTDVQQGRLVILEYSEDIINQIQKLSELSPVLRELEWLLKDAHPQRIIFDPVTQLVIGEKGELRPRIAEFTTWASSFGATVLMIANGNGKEIIQELHPFVRDSFKFDFKEIDGRATRFFTFEKSKTIAEQAVEVDPSRGVFLLEKPLIQSTDQVSGKPASTKANRDEKTSILPVSAEPTANLGGAAHTSEPARRVVEPLILESQTAGEKKSPSEKLASLATSEVAALNEIAAQLPESGDPLAPEQTAKANRTTEFGRTSEDNFHEFSDFLEELDSAIAAIDVNFMEADGKTLIDASNAHDLSQASGQAEDLLPQTDKGADETRMIAQQGRRVGYSKHAADSFYQGEGASHWAPINTLTLERNEQAQIIAKDFHIVVIDEDDLSCKRVSKALEDYSILSAQDLVSGIANIMATNADLIILDIDMSIADGFKVLSHLRSSTSAPIIVLSKTHIRSADRIFSSELGADYYLTKPFSAKELKQKAKQLIARYRGIDSWIIVPSASASQPHTSSPIISVEELKPVVERRANFSGEVIKMKTERIAAYTQFIEQVEANVKRSMERNTAFSIVGYRLENPGQDTDEKLKEVADLLGSFVRNADLVSINEHRELVVLLHDTNSIGARAFISRARRRLPETFLQQFSTWMRSFPNLEEEFESAYAS